METLEFDSADLLNYLSEVLGIQSIYQNEEMPRAAGLIVGKVVFWVDHKLSEKAQELFERMIKAMKLLEGEYFVRCSSLMPGGEDSGAFLVKFCQQGQQLRKYAAGSQFIETWSPEVLLVQPELKKQVWDDLQLVIRENAARNPEKPNK